MIEWLVEYKYLVLIFIVLLILCIIIMRKAGKALSEHNKAVREEEERIQHLTNLKNQFRIISNKTILNAAEKDLIEGIALHYQLELEKEVDINSAFLALPDAVKYVYALDVFLSEEGNLSDFFKNNGKPLTEVIIPALEAINENEIAALSVPLNKMYDSDDEETSIDYKVIDECNKKFENIFDRESFCLRTIEFIKNNNWG